MAIIGTDLGTKLKVPTLDGNNVEVSVPSGTQSDEVLRLRGKGLTAFGGGRGDLNLRIQVHIPERPSPLAANVDQGQSDLHPNAR